MYGVARHENRPACSLRRDSLADVLRTWSGPSGKDLTPDVHPLLWPENLAEQCTEVRVSKRQSLGILSKIDVINKKPLHNAAFTM